MASPPVVVSLRMSPNTVATGETVSVIAEWTADPKTGITYQWRQGLSRIAGETSPAYRVDGTESALNCLVTIDNGIGTAIAVAIFTNQPEPDPEEPEVPSGDGEFSDDFSDEFA